MFFVKKRKKESVAIPFLISMLISLLVIGLPVVKLYSHLIDKKVANETSKTAHIFSPSESNNFTSLIVFDTDDPALRDTFAIMRTSVTNKKFTFVPVSNNIISTSGKTKAKMSDIYKNGGIIELKKAVEGTFDIKIDRHITLNDEAFTLICDVLGGVNYNVPDGLRGLNEGIQYLSSEFVIKLITNKKFEEEPRTVTVGNVAADMLTQTSGDRVIDALDYTFNKLINIVETDITSIDYADQKEALIYLLTNNQFQSTYIVPEGSQSDSGITISETFLNTMKKDFGL